MYWSAEQLLWDNDHKTHPSLSSLLTPFSRSSPPRSLLHIWCTYDAVSDEAREEVQYNGGILVFRDAYVIEH